MPIFIMIDFFIWFVSSVLLLFFYFYRFWCFFVLFFCCFIFENLYPLFKISHAVIYTIFIILYLLASFPWFCFSFITLVLDLLSFWFVLFCWKYMNLCMELSYLFWILNWTSCHNSNLNSFRISIQNQL